MNLKLLLYSFDWFPSTGGIQTVTMALANGLSKHSDSDGGRKIDVTLVTETAADGMNDSCLKFRVIRRPGRTELLREIRAADIVHLAGPSLPPLGISLLFGKRIVVEHHGYQAICPNGLLLFGAEHSLCPGHFMKGNYEKCLQCNSESIGVSKSLRSLVLTFVRRWMNRRVTVNVAPSRHIADRIALPRTKIIFHGVTSVPLKENSAADASDHAPDCFAFVGRLVKEKGGEILLRAARQLAEKKFEFRLKIVGDGPERGALEKLAAELGLLRQTEFLGWVPVDTVTNVLTEASAVVMPSLWEDVAPLVALEQMMQGRLVIASDIGGLGETVGGYGLRFPAGDVAALEQCMQRVIEDRAAIARMRIAAQQHAFAVYQESRMVEEHRRLYLRLIGSQSNEGDG